MIDDNSTIVEINDEIAKAEILLMKKIINCSQTIDIKQSDIDTFYTMNPRCENDNCNKKREKIISMIANNSVTNEWYNDEKWTKLRDEIKNYEKINSPDKYNKCVWITKAGRKNCIDFNLKYFDEGKIIKKRKVEFKYNVDKVSDCPQWASPMRPSQYLVCEKTFEEHFYNNYLLILCKAFGREMPDKAEYLKQIHSNKSKCIIDMQDKYYNGSSGSKGHYTGLEEDIKFYDLCIKNSKESIDDYFNICELDHKTLNKYLIEKQKGKEYMLYKDGKIYHEVHTQDDYTIDPEKVIKASPNFLCTTLSGKKMKILLRWKNGNGIAFPAFQIK
jgi:hypothetical protein